MGRNTTDDRSSRVPPYSKEAETAVLGSALLNNRSLIEVRGTLSADDFYVEAHRRVFIAMCEIVDSGIALDHITLGNELIKRGDLDKIGGPMALDNLTESVVTVANVSHYARIVKNKASTRRLIYAAQQVVADGFSDHEDTMEFITKARSAIIEVAAQAAQVEDGPEHISTGFNKLYQRLEGQQPVADFLSFGFGGIRIRKGVPTVVGARPSNGKTVFCSNGAVNLARQGYKTLVFNLEDKRETLWSRIISSTTAVDLPKVEDGKLDLDSWRRITDVASSITGLPIWVYDRVGVSSDWIRHAAAVHKERHGLDVVIVDYLQLMKEKGADRYDKFSNAVEGLTILARELDIAVVIVSQIKRIGYVAGKIPPSPTPEDLKETGVLEQSAKTIFLLHYPAYYDKDGTNPEVDPEKIRCETAKQSNGPTGVRWLYFKPQYMWMGDRSVYSGSSEWGGASDDY